MTQLNINLAILLIISKTAQRTSTLLMMISISPINLKSWTYRISTSNSIFKNKAFKHILLMKFSKVDTLIIIMIEILLIDKISLRCQYSIKIKQHKMGCFKSLKIE